MAPAVSAGDIVMVDSKAFRANGPARWDIVAFVSMRSGRPHVYRVAALPGEQVELREGVLVIDGQPQAPFPGATESGRPGARRDMAPRVVPPDHFFLLGDNRDFAEDSRYTGPVPRESLVGRVVQVYR
jgi:signal peptidase I